MENARVAIFEDAEEIREMARIYLVKSGHTVVAEASNVPEALELVNRISEDEIQVDFILLDGNLTPRTDNGDDARNILAKIEHSDIGSQILGFSSRPFSDYRLVVDADPGKNTKKVLEIIDQS